MRALIIIVLVLLAISLLITVMPFIITFAFVAILMLGHGVM